MARAADYIEGWPAVVAAAGLGAVLLLCACFLWGYSYAFPAARSALATYRNEAPSSGGRRSDLRGLALLLVALCVVTQLLYANLYIELAQWLAGAREPPRVFVQAFFWVALVDLTCAGACVYTGVRPD